MEASERVVCDGPHFEDFEVGRVYEDAPSLTLTPGHAALHQSLLGDRLRLPLDRDLSVAVTGTDRELANPNLICDVAIGQSTGPTQRVLGNLFYRGLVLLRPTYIGDTLRTRTEVVALKQNRPRDDGSGSGLVVLRIQTENQDGEPVLDFWRCPMIPMRDGATQTGHADSFDQIPADLEMDQVTASIPAHWDLDAFRERVPGDHLAELAPGTTFEVAGRDTVSSATQLARLTLNVAKAHTDPAATAHGRRLVYGGHTIGIAAAQLTRALPNLVTLTAWRGCDHLAPVFEGDVLGSEVEVEAVHPLENGGGLVDLRVRVEAERADGGERLPVLDWRPLGLMA
ncbi:MAG: MaoC family dehydratase [Actinomycetota bacterium]|nr:MaoC family dehydratase [Actinomycetota bacterium]